MTIRGIAGTNTTSFYINDTPVPLSLDPRVLDLQRVEVLRGPQGTLFGQSSTGGAINYILGKPTDTYESGFDASYERFGRTDVSGYVSGPLSSTLNARFAARGIEGGAWQKSVTRDDKNGATRKIMGRLNPNFRKFKEPVSALSGGQRQSVAIARAVYFNAKILKIGRAHV